MAHRGGSGSLGTFPSPHAACREAALTGPWSPGCEQLRRRWRCRGEGRCEMPRCAPEVAEPTAWTPPSLTLGVKSQANQTRYWATAWKRTSKLTEENVLKGVDIPFTDDRVMVGFR